MELNLNRIKLLVRRQLLKDGKKYSIAIGTGFLIALLIATLNMMGEPDIDPEVYAGTTASMFIIGGCILSSSMFSELDKQDSGYQFMALPVSNLERLISAWLVSFALFSVVAVLITYLGAGILTLASSFHTPQDPHIYETLKVGEIVLGYAALNALFLMGGATFKNWAFVKTSLAVTIISFMVSGAMALIAWVIVRGVMGTSKVAMMNNNHMVSNQNINMQSFFENHSEIIGALSFGLLLIFCWTVTYFKLKEREI